MTDATFPRDLVIAALREVGVQARPDPDDPEGWQTPEWNLGTPTEHWRAVCIARKAIGQDQETFEEWCVKGRNAAAADPYGPYGHIADWLDEWGCP